MLKGRSLNVRMVKNEGAVDNNPFDYDRLVRTVTKSVILITLIYMGGDTVRQVVINAAKAAKTG